MDYPRIITHHEFCEAFQKAVEDWNQQGTSSAALGWRDLTKLMLGSGEEHKLQDFGIIGQAAKRISPAPTVTAEDYRVDQMWWYSWNPKKKEVEAHLDWHSLPWYCAVAIEHENCPDLRKFVYLLRKLFVIRAALKVCVVSFMGPAKPCELLRPYTERGGEIMLSEVPDSGKAEYLVCFGISRDGSLSKFTWSLIAWDSTQKAWNPVKT